MTSGKKLIVICGPTGVGKTELSVRLAKHFKMPVINADSRQVYREMKIGTARPNEEEMEGVPHYLFGHRSIREEYNAGIYETEVLGLLEDLFIEAECVILSGGTGLYIQAVCKGLDDLPQDPDVREDLERTLEKEGLEPLLEELCKKDPDHWNAIDRANARRVIRALEVIRITGRPVSSLRTGDRKPRPFGVIKVGLDMDRSELYRRINARVDRMMEMGLLDEVRLLREYEQHKALSTVGYKELLDYLSGKISLERAIDLIKRNSRRYAKRQLTWFRRDQDITWFHPEEEGDITAFIEKQLAE